MAVSLLAGGGLPTVGGTLRGGGNSTGLGRSAAGRRYIWGTGQGGCAGGYGALRDGTDMGRDLRLHTDGGGAGCPAGTDVSLSDGGAGACPDGNRAGIRQTLCALSGAGQPVSAGRGGTGAFSARIRPSADGADPDPLKRRQNGGAAAGSGTVRTAQRRGGSLCGVRCAAERDGRGRTGG